MRHPVSGGDPGLRIALAPATAVHEDHGALHRSQAMSRSSHLSVALSLAVASGLGVARAEPPPQAGTAEVGHLEDVVVTAQRREESAQSIGVALTVLTADALKDAGITKVNDLENTTPSLEVEPAFGSGQ